MRQQTFPPASPEPSKQRESPDNIAICGTCDPSISNSREPMTISRHIPRYLVDDPRLDAEAPSVAIKMDPGLMPTTLYEPLMVEWRMRNHEIGALKFGTGCVGDFRLSEDVPGGVTGVLRVGVALATSAGLAAIWPDV
ncbi:hypothetical protein PSPO01_03691 [Paraphaeosphaeria sporulosa]